MKTVLMARDRELFALLARARWLSSSQIHRTFFPKATLNAVQKRLRKLMQTGFLASARPNRFEPQYLRLTALGAETVRFTGAIPRRLPGQLREFAAVNDIRLWFLSRHGIDADRFVATWEGPSVAQHPVVPDARFVPSSQDRHRTLAVHVGSENPSQLVKKLSAYREAEDFDGLLLWLFGPARIKRFVAACVQAEVPPGRPECWIGDLERIQDMDSESALINLERLMDGESAVTESLADILASPLELSLREESEMSPK